MSADDSLSLAEKDDEQDVGDSKQSSFADMDHLFDDEDLRDSTRDDDDEDHIVVTEMSPAVASVDKVKREGGRLTPTQQKKKASKRIKVRASDFSGSEGSKKDLERVVMRWRSNNQKRNGSWIPRIVLRSSSRNIERQASAAVSDISAPSMDSKDQAFERDRERKSTSRSNSRTPLRKISSITLGSQGSFVQEKLRSMGRVRKSRRSKKGEGGKDSVDEGAAKTSRWGASTESRSIGSSQHSRTASAPPTPPRRCRGVNKAGLSDKERAILGAGITSEMIEKLNAAGYFISDTP